MALDLVQEAARILGHKGGLAKSLRKTKSGRKNAKKARAAKQAKRGNR
jgi:hypothetical protein